MVAVLSLLVASSVYVPSCLSLLNYEASGVTEVPWDLSEGDCYSRACCEHAVSYKYYKL